MISLLSDLNTEVFSFWELCFTDTIPNYADIICCPTPNGCEVAVNIFVMCYIDYQFSSLAPKSTTKTR
ncbi:hypothetical protein AB6A40_002209 [Gnathostoma spinigerum]|uniref:Uncharacterized protein n=1 Tax=Gnathostoma spinigerum TaxID=75299 RepID=A0ABD6E605_9BILA